MSKYTNMSILKQSKKSVKIYFFYLMDIFIVLGALLIVYLINEYILKLPAFYLILWEIGTFAFGVFLCYKPFKYGGVNNLTILKRLLSMDHEIYKVQSYK